MSEETKQIDGRNMRSIVTKQKLLDAAREVYYEFGFKKTTISQIIKRAETGYGTAYVHFKGKDEILIALMETVMQEFLDMAHTPFLPTSKEEAKELVLNQVTSFLTMAKSNKDIMKVFAEAISLSPAVNEKWDDIRKTNIHFIIRDITYAQSQGLVRSDLKIDIVARSWFFINENHQWDLVRDNTSASIEDIAWTITTMYIDGIYK
ncbi:TetR/AcrR family transcriptional regulator [Lysinibacillus fusiformis]|uniref:TetR/AcrR family transcriptional regulator n=1 Tax=Lysinibacillus fusiformis TaxID=28031 RepID=UPI0037F84073